MPEHPISLGPEARADVNEVAAYLALDDTGLCAAGAPAALADLPSVDLVILAGNGVLATAEGAFGAVARGLAERLLIAGGIGHSTPFLWRAVEAHPRYRAIAAAGRPEADILREIAERYWDVPARSIMSESVSTSCGDNAIQARRVLDAAGLRPERVLLVQDPTMQRRTDASFRKAWQDRRPPRFLNWPTFVPRLEPGPGPLRYAAPGGAGLWTIERFLSMVMGEIPRLRLDGYGPAGRAFIAAVEIPPAIESAYARLQKALGGAFADRSRLPAG